MNRIQRQSRAASDFSIARILAEDHPRKSGSSSSISKIVEKVRGEDDDFLSRLETARETIGDGNSLSSSRLEGKFRSFGDLDRADGDGPFDFRSSRTNASQTPSSQLPRGIREPEIQRIETSELSWLQCTRYRPPKLLRKSAAGKSGKRRPGAHPRIPFTTSQLQVLEEKYRKTAYLSRRDVIQLSTLLRLPQSRVKIWFQNRRARDRRETSVSGGSVTVLSADAPSARISREDIPGDNSAASNPV